MLKLICVFCLFKLGLSHSMCSASLIFNVNSVDAVSIIEKHELLHLFYMLNLYLRVEIYVRFCPFLNVLLS